MEVIKYLLNILLASVFLALSSCSKRKEDVLHQISIYKLVASPDEFDGYLISTSGYLSKDLIEGYWALYLHENFSEISFVKGSVYVQNSKNISLEKFNGSYVTLTGMFREDDDFNKSISFFGKIEISSIHDGYSFKPAPNQ
jgi:hypothetical protein